MIAIYKRELKSYFNSMLGYIVTGFFLIVVGLYFWGNNLSGQSPMIGTTLSSICFMYSLGIPALTMRTLAEEQKQKTDQLLFSSPVSIWDVILGKYLAVVTVFTLPVLVICTMPLVLSMFGEVAFLRSYSTIFAFWLLGCVLLAVGVLISSMTDNQIIALIISLVVNIVIFLMSSIASIISETAFASLIGFSVLALIVAVFIFLFAKNIVVAGGIFAVAEVAMIITYVIKSELFESKFITALTSISFYTRFSEFINGSFSLSSVVYYISFICLFLYLSMQAVQKRRWS